MLKRLFYPPTKRSFFLFGARATGKSTLLREVFSQSPTHFVDLLDPEYYRLTARGFEATLKALPQDVQWVIVDEIQRSPEILNVVHRWLSKPPASRRVKFAMTGSNARKLKRGGANLLAGRANVFHMHPLTHREMPEGHTLAEMLKWGGLPEVVLEPDVAEKRRILRAYTTTYLREEIAEEQIVRVLEPFAAFLPVAAQMNGKIVNYSNIAEDVGVSTPTIQSYFEILADTLLAFIVPAWHGSVRKRQRTNPKIYFFDLGVVESLVSSSLGEASISSFAGGNRFEQFIFLEIFRLQSYAELDWRFSYLRTREDAEIDLIIERPNQKTLLVEIKATDNVFERHARTLNRFLPDFKNSEAILISNDPVRKRFGHVVCVHWRDWLHEVVP